MENPVTSKPMPASLPDFPTNHSGKLFGIVYITLTGMIDTIIPAAGLWSWVGKSLLSYGGPCPLKHQPKLPQKTTGRLSNTGSLTIPLDPVPEKPQIDPPFIASVATEPMRVQYLELGKITVQ
ncbi:hypothetical protein DSO57_1035714 [Entomophthora muscae]|uniref:Uncharacterized protein n=1 Tax=Entomophthora muscae TaxID=34485 RepID=A0ACC2S1E0_9FUNG|nr:hypothetical protein DSO57_1035714 [Entomophthora muscae]